MRDTREDGGPAPESACPAGLGSRLARSWHEAVAHFLLAPLWGFAMALSALTALFLEGRAGNGRMGSILVLFFAGGLLAFPLSVFASSLLVGHRRTETRFAAVFVCLTVLTIAVTAFLFAMQYRLFFARWHAPFATRIWFFQFAFTSAGAFYQFIVMGIRLYMPLGLPALLAMSLWLARPRRVRR